MYYAKIIYLKTLKGYFRSNFKLKSSSVDFNEQKMKFILDYRDNYKKYIRLK
jgi:hypothetical protein